MSGFSVNVRTNAGLVAAELMAEAQDMRDKAMVRALNKMAEQVKVQAARAVRDAGYNLKIRTIKSALSIKRATAGNLKAVVIAKGAPIPLIEYSATASVRGVTVKVFKGRKTIGKAFIATMPSGHRGVYIREPGGKHRKVNNTRGGWHQLPINQLFGPAVPDALASAAIADALKQVVAERFPKLLEHESEFLARKLKAR